MNITPFFSSLRFRLTLWYSGLLAVFLVLFAGATYTVVVRILVNQEVTLERETVQFDIKDPNGAGITIELPRRAIEDRALRFGCPPGITRPNPLCVGRVPLQYRELLREQMLQGESGSGDHTEQQLQPSVEKTDVVRVGFEEETREAVRRSLLRFLILMIPLLIALSGLGGYIIARRALRPISVITDTANRIREGNLHERINLLDSHDEFQRLADTLDEMLAELQHLFEREKRFASDASHELQTPLAVIRTSAEVALTDPDVTADARESFLSIIESTERISRIVDDLLLLATLEQHNAPRATTQVHPLVEGVLKHLSPLAEAKGITLTLVNGHNVHIRTAEDRLERAVSNLVENAIKYSEHGGVTVEVQPQKRHVTIAITDTGPGIDAKHLPHLFERFYRVDKGRSRAAGGTGLGLAIVHAAVTSLGGRLSVESEVGKGSTFSIVLPRG